MEKAPLTPLFHASARQGIIFGILFTAMSFCLLGCLQVPALSLVLLLLTVAVGAYLPVGLAAVASVNPAYRSFPAMWMSGIVQFLCGDLICSLLTALFLIYVQPDFLGEYVREMVRQFVAAGGNGAERDLSKLMIPSVTDFVSSMFWATGFFGSILSLLAGAILPRTSLFRRLVNARRAKIIT